MNLYSQQIQTVHLVGVKGVGVAAVACMLKDLDKSLSGSDTKDTQITDLVLKKIHLKPQVFSSSNIYSDIDLVIYSGAYPLTHPEIKKAKAFKIPALSQAKALANLMEPKKQILVCGVGGKTTTTAMLIHTFKNLKKTPSWFIGTSHVNDKLLPGKLNKGDVFIAEADEYAINPPQNKKPKFSLYKPDTIICTNLEFDHPDIYSNFDQTLKTFLDFFNRLPQKGHLIINQDTKRLDFIRQNLRPDIQLTTFGQTNQADFTTTSQKDHFIVTDPSGKTYPCKLQTPGVVNAKNAVAAALAANLYSIPIDKSLTSLSSFTGTMRRFELIKTKNRIHYYDDYAHHPKEIQASLQAFRQKFPKSRIITIFHAHTFSRTKALLNDFSASFADSDVVIVTKIFSSAREEKDVSISGKILTQAIQKHHPKTLYIKDFSAIIDYINSYKKPGDVIITMGAGNIYQIHQNL